MDIELVETDSLKLSDEDQIESWLEDHKNWTFGCEEGSKNFQSLTIFFSPNGSGDATRVLGHVQVDFTGSVGIDCNCKFTIDGDLTSPGDDYNFEMHPWTSGTCAGTPRNLATLGGQVVNGSGTSYHININGTKHYNQTGTQGLFGD